jgi:hypothetical protein
MSEQNRSEVAEAAERIDECQHQWVRSDEGEVRCTAGCDAVLSLRTVPAMADHVEQAMAWLRENPGSDHLDAAYAVAQRSDSYTPGRYQWPEFVGRVRTEASETREAQPLVDQERAEAEVEREVER